MTQSAIKLHPNHAPALPNIYVIASGKGGVGKTWCSITLSTLLARSGKRVLLFDGDIGLANIDIQLGLNPSHDLYDLLSQKCDLTTAITHYSDQSETQKVSFDILPGRSGSGLLANLSPQQQQLLSSNFQTLSDTYDAVIIDLGAGIDHSIRNLAKIGLNQIIVTTTEPTALTDAYAYIKVMHHINPALKFQILVNRSPNEQMGMRTFNTLKKVCESYLKFAPTLAGILEEDINISQAIRRQKSMLMTFPQSKSIQQLDRIKGTIFD